MASANASPFVVCMPKGHHSSLRLFVFRYRSRRCSSKLSFSKCPCVVWKHYAACTNAIYAEASRSFLVAHSKRKPGSLSDVDYISLLNERICNDLRKNKAKGLQKLKGDSQKNGGFGYWVDPYTLQPGDYVVHRKVGIGRFVAIKDDLSKNSLENSEYVFIEYADGMAKLPVKQAFRMLYRYNLPNETKKPHALCKLNDTSAWERRRIKGKLAIQKMVVDLMELYLHRLKQSRPPYPKPLAMSEFIAQFPYEPTQDQNQAFIDVEKDLMERGTPMDRLICGDVGFGKTEVALRAIFIVVSSGKQAMVLVPTIVLAKQHFDVISERFSSYSHIHVGLMSRYPTKSEKEEHILMIKNGHLDIIVGTHALLSDHVVYNKLGLLVVDEEQRFGVKQKEKIASFKTSVDVLTLSATPIRFWLLRQFLSLSLILTPPPERVPIKTHLSVYSEEKIISAIKFELDRGGQIFYVLPRIKGLEEVMEFLELNFPDVTIAIAHGKQCSKQLQETMKIFSLGGINILICTNIVESGLNIENANTIIIQDVQLFGLAQVYQLRGRVGRADRDAYAYLFYPDKSLLSDQALERFVAIEEYQELGQGFQLAERDMGIRGFGSIFGEQQSGDIGNVGVDLFFEMLFESLSKVDEHRVIPVAYKDVQIDLDINPRLSSEYIINIKNPIELINEAEKAAGEGMQSLIQFTQQLRHLYGKEPRSMEMLLKMLFVRRMAADLGISRVYSIGKIVFMTTNMNKKAFKLLSEGMISIVHRNSLTYIGQEIKAELLMELPKEQLVNWIFQCLTELHASLPALVKY
ncbi:hypothetical protein HPP92_009750 [Vanilla planifolia]|uniref:Uncharacterized protein n=1 Tax=Vanilla planifolia TaxID=51239 RepID=A0A835RAN7_VANPL|nr:hypothetical protein HPP92_009750 [Vanilla planifolia]